MFSLLFSKKTFKISLAVLSIIGYGAFVFAAVGPFAPGTELDPACSPYINNDPLQGVDTNCNILQVWDINNSTGEITSNQNYGKIGIGLGASTTFSGISTDVHIRGTNLILNSTEGGSYKFQGDLSAINPAFGEGFLFGTTTTSLLVTDSFNGQSNISVSLNGAGGARSGMNFKNEVATGNGMTGVIEGKANANTSKRYGFSFWAGRTSGALDSSDHYEFDPVYNLDTKGFFVTSQSLYAKYLFNVTSSSSYNMHFANLDTDGWRFNYNQTGEDWETAQTTFFVNNGIQITNSSQNQVFGVLSDGSINSAVLLGGGSLEADVGGNIILAPSDEKLKTNVSSLTANLDKIMRLRPVSYNWKDKEKFGSATDIGFIAQEVEVVIPEIVTQGPDYKSLDYKLLTPVLTGAIQELNLKLESIESKSQIVVTSSGFSLDGLQDWLGDMGNGIENIFARVIQADILKAKEQFCVGETCISETEFIQLLESRSITPDVPHESNDSPESENTDEVTDEVVLSEDQSTPSSESSETEEIIPESSEPESLSEITQ